MCQLRRVEFNTEAIRRIVGYIRLDDHYLLKRSSIIDHVFWSFTSDELRRWSNTIGIGGGAGWELSERVSSLQTSIVNQLQVYNLYIVTDFCRE